MVSDFIDEHNGYLTRTDAEYEQGKQTYPDLQQQASRLTIVSREAKKKQAVREERVCYLQVAPLYAVNKPPLKLSLSYQGLSTF